ncbi:MAG: hypothetical protein N2255_00085, partial [Kiritimatiellae bacterium]|nr:hypothetical protein [Kiritimatiellia bacterium]
ARATLRTGLFDLVRLLSALETANPYLCVVSLSITPQTAGDPERHNVSFDVQWPVWNDENTLIDLERQFQEEMSPEVTPSYEH